MNRSPPERVPLALLLARWGRLASQTARLMIGQPDYETYVAHVRQHHPDKTPMSRDVFFRNRQDRRYGEGTAEAGERCFRCC